MSRKDYGDKMNISRLGPLGRLAINKASREMAKRDANSASMRAQIKNDMERTKNERRDK